MSDWGVGYAIGIATGLAIGLVAGRKRKAWSELDKKERRIRIMTIAFGVAALAIGLFVYFRLT